MHDIFLSYSRTEVKIAQKIKQTFLDAEFTICDTVFADRDTDDWIIKTTKGMSKSLTYVFVSSPDALKSHWVQTIFHRMNFRIWTKIPTIYFILINGDVEEAIPSDYENYTIFDIRNGSNYEKVMQRIITVIQRIHLQLIERMYPSHLYWPLEFLRPRKEYYSREEISLSLKFQSTKQKITDIWFKYQQGQIDDEEKGEGLKNSLLRDEDENLWSFHYWDNIWYRYDEEEFYGRILPAWKQAGTPVPLDLDWGDISLLKLYL